MRGFTLLELMLVLVLAGIILGLGIPAMGNFIRNSRVTAAANDVMVAMHFARSEAIKRRSRVVVCSSADAMATAPQCAASALLTGWIVFVDSNGNGQWDDDWTFNDVDGDGNQDVEETDANSDGVWDPDDPAEDIDGDGNQDVLEPDVEEVVLLQHEPLPAGIVARSSVSPLAITYLDNGTAAATTAGQLVICDSRGNVPSGGQLSAARAIAISPTGRASVSRDLQAIQDLIDALSVNVAGCTPS